MRNIDTIFIHCSATRPSQDIGAEVIKSWHLDRGWSDIGYHYVIRRDGEIETGRAEELPGAHAKGHNQNSLGICVVGGIDSSGSPDSNFTRAQWHSLEELVKRLTGPTGPAPGANVRGHREVSHKACPCFDVSAWWHG